MKAKLRQVKPHIFVLDFKRHYDLAMSFLRVQETYESPNPKFRGQQFGILEFMDWYVHHYKRSCFTYPHDWGGFNVPSRILDLVYGNKFPSDRAPKSAKDRRAYVEWAMTVARVQVRDWTTYDEFMARAHFELKLDHPTYYLVGISGGNESTLKHETAHGLYFTSPEYKTAADKLVRDLPKRVKDRMWGYFRSIGYDKSVFVDETQAYLATGLTKTLKKYSYISSRQAPFRKLFKTYSSV